MGHGVAALDLLEDKTGELKGNPLRFSSALFVRPPFKLSGERVLADVPSKSRTLVADVRGGDRAFVAASLAIWWPPDSRRLFGGSADHDLCDVYLAWLDQHPSELEFLAMVRPQGPLAVSFIRGKPAKTPSRYDVIYASPEFEVLDVRCVYGDAIRAGSDHGLVWSRLRLRARCLTSADRHSRCDASCTVTVSREDPRTARAGYPPAVPGRR